MLGFGCCVLAFDGGKVFVLHFQHDVDGWVVQLFVELQERLQLDRIGVGAGTFSCCLLGVMDFLFAVRFLPGLFWLRRSSIGQFLLKEAG